MSTQAAGVVTGVDFVSVPTQDLARAVDFFGDVLGLPMSVHRPERSFAEFETGTVTLSLIDPARIGREFSATSQPIALRVEDVEAARAALEARGVTFVAPTIDSGVCHMAVFHDPDGNALMLHRRYAPSPARS